MVYFQQLDITHQDSGADETCVSSISSISTTQLSVEDDGKSKKATGTLFKAEHGRTSCCGVI